MRKFFVCAGLVVAGTTALHAAYAPDLNSMETSKMWSVSGTLRGFYDDNYNTAPSGSGKRGSYGFEVSPSLSLNVPLQQTELGLRATYGLYYYQDQMELNGRPIDQTEQLDLWMDHAFTERWKTKVQDTFVMGQEPALLNGGSVYRISGDNLHNDGSIALQTQWTPLVGTTLSYHNNLYHWQNGAYQGLLDRMQNDVGLNVNWTLQRTLLVFVGYQFEQVNYTGNDIIAQSQIQPPFGPIITTYSDNRDNRSQYGYVGARYTPLDNLNLAARAGIQYVDYYNPAAGLSSSDTLSPYANISATYTYLPGSYVQFGFTQTRNATDVSAYASNGQVTLDQESSIIYGVLNHRITPRITGNLIGKIQYSTFNGGALDNQSQTWYSVGVNLTYALNPHVSTEVGYNFDDVTSAGTVAPGYNRNRVYVGITGTY